MISKMKHLVVTTGTNLFLTGYKDHEQNRSSGVCGNFFSDINVCKFCLNVGKLLFCGC